MENQEVTIVYYIDNALQIIIIKNENYLKSELLKILEFLAMEMLTVK